MPLFKNTIYLLLSVSLIIGCSKDDGPTTTDDSAKVVGDYTLSAVNVNPAQDLNEDGTASTNLIDEMTCVTGALRINADKSWNLNIIRINVTGITGGLFFIDCGDADTSSGTWTFSNNQLSLNGSFDATVYVLSGETLTRQIGEDLPSFQSVAFTKN